MFIPEGFFDKLICCRRKDPKLKKKKEKDEISNGGESDIIMMQQHTNNNLSEYVSAEELKEVSFVFFFSTHTIQELDLVRTALPS